jgi:hypothetical protein
MPAAVQPKAPELANYLQPFTLSAWPMLDGSSLLYHIIPGSFQPQLTMLGD